MDSKVTLPLLITSAIKPVAIYTALQDPDRRLYETVKAIEHWLEMGVTNVVICDGSGFDIENAVKEKLNSTQKVNFEFIVFTNDASSVARLGKGYGEGQIVAKALERSELIREYGAFAKCTGKFWVKNAMPAMTHFESPFKADVFGRLSIKYVDTRFYLSTVDFYQRWLKDCYLSVNDPLGYWLEHAFLDQLKLSGLNDWIARPAFWTEGLSGTKGLNQHRKVWKESLRTVRNHLFASIYLS